MLFSKKKFLNLLHAYDRKRFNIFPRTKLYNLEHSDVASMSEPEVSASPSSQGEYIEDVTVSEKPRIIEEVIIEEISIDGMCGIY